MNRVPLTTVLRCTALLCALTGCAETAAGTSPETNRQTDTPQATVACAGIPGKPPASDSYLPGAPDIEKDGDGLLVEVTVITLEDDGTCRVAPEALVEIWHTGADGRYLDDAWRTARTTGADGATSYLTARPVPEEDFPHLHIRVTPRDAAPQDWVVSITADGPRELRLILLAGSPTETSLHNGPGV